MAGTHAHPARLTGAEGTREGLRAIRLSAIALGASAAIRLTIAAISGSVALLAAGLDDLGDVLTTVALSLAFVASRRAADRRYTFGYQRVEDLSGVLVVLVIWGSAGFATYEAISKLTGDHEISRIGIAMAAAALGLAANGFAGLYKIRVGRRIGSEPLISDGKHALTDGLASIAALAGLIGVRAGWAEADPIAAFVVVAAIIAVAVDASRNVLTRLLDAVDPEIVNRIENIVLGTPGVAGCGRIQARWAGRSLYVTATVAADGNLSLADAHAVGEAVNHRILHDVGGVAQVDVHVDPWEPHGSEQHAETEDHDERSASEIDAETHHH
ncbi:MAG TPA: cation diffusion facilitator family transporter [Actinomycetota bacterium]|nr:cation diffusion facilitator family transporter [Actinomycetota bacterium]